MPNADGVGYYRFALDDADWRTLIAASPTLGAGEALATSDSLWGAFRAGELAPARLIEAARALVAHPDSNASVDGGERLAGLRLRGLIPDSALADYRLTMASIYAPKLAALGSDPRAGAYAADPSDRQKQRSALVRLVAEEARDQDLRAKLLDAAQRYLAGDAASLDQSELGVGLSVYVDSEGLAGSKELLKRLVSSQDQLFRSHALDALGSSDQPEQARWLLGVLDGPTLRQTEKLDLLSEIMLQPATRDIAYQYLTANFERLSKDAGIFSFGRLLDMPKYYCSAERAQELEKTLGARERQYRRGSLELARTVESVRSCGLLLQSRGAELVKALHGT
jgi:aminopeptidase N